jgi:hypothetical protein
MKEGRTEEMVEDIKERKRRGGERIEQKKIEEYSIRYNNSICIIYNSICII